MKYAAGDVNTSLIQTSDGITVTLYYDTKNPRPADWIYRIQGTKGIYSGTLNKIYLEDISPKPHAWEAIDKYQEKYDHPLWKKYGTKLKVPDMEVVIICVSGIFTKQYVTG